MSDVIYPWIDFNKSEGNRSISTKVLPSSAISVTAKVAGLFERQDTFKNDDQGTVGFQEFMEKCVVALELEP